MGDPYWGYGAPAAGGSIPRTNFLGYLPSEPSQSASHHVRGSNDLQGIPSQYVQRDLGAYGIDGTGIGVRPEPSLGGVPAGASIKGYPTLLQDPILHGQRPDVAAGVGSSISNLINGRAESLAMVDGPPVSARESNVLFVDGLPSDCLRREVGHLFRPFIGFKEIRVVHKEPRRMKRTVLPVCGHGVFQSGIEGNFAVLSGDKAMVLCFVEFDEAKCALTALEALQGYKFDDKKPNSPVLRIHFAHFPFRLPTDHIVGNGSEARVNHR